MVPVGLDSMGRPSLAPPGPRPPSSPRSSTGRRSHPPNARERSGAGSAPCSTSTRALAPYLNRSLAPRNARAGRGTYTHRRRWPRVR